MRRSESSGPLPPPPPRGEIPKWSRKYIGREIGFRFRIDKALAAGGMGSIFLGEQTNLSRQVAIKLVRTGDVDMIQRMRQEAKSLAAVTHPAIVEVYDFVAVTGSRASDCYLVMAYVPGDDLARYLDGKVRTFLPPAEGVHLLMPIASALVELHARSIIHRDIKLSNIIRFESADGTVRTKLVDFGFARGKFDPSLTAKGIVVGTPAYFAPEIVLGKSHSPASDVYAFGVTLCKLLTGESPHGRADIGDLLQKAVQKSVALPSWLMSTSLGPLVQAMLRRKPEERPTMREVLEGLEACKESMIGVDPDSSPGAVAGAQDETDPMDAGHVTAPMRGARSQGRGAAVWVLGGLCVMLAAAVVFFALRWGPKTTPPPKSAGAEGSMVAAAPGRGPSRPAAMRVGSRSRPQMRPRGRVQPRTRVRPMGKPADNPVEQTVAEIRLGCDSQATMRRLFHPARKIIIGRRRGNLEHATRTLQALLPAKCTPNATRHWVSYYLTMAFVRQGKCVAARRAWTLYEQYHLQRRRKKPSFPRCP